MEILRTIPDMQLEAERVRCAGKKLALVPTMGALHDGHLSLVKRAIEIADHVTVSIFVNPMQFGPDEDFEEYPRRVESDIEKLSDLGGVDVVFLPSTESMYPKGQGAHHAWVLVDTLDRYLCGAYREGHFRGVTTVVTKLFNACRPHYGVFGLKDAQQFLILRRMVHDLNAGIELVGVPTYREPDGLAASSRNVFLSEKERAEAPAIYQGLQQAKEAVESGERDAGTLRNMLKNHIEENTGGVVQYAEVVETDTVQPIGRLIEGQEILIATAVFFGNTRLIDNVFVNP